MKHPSSRMLPASKASRRNIVSDRELSRTIQLPQPRKIPRELSNASATTECTFHQLSPYIGKLKSTIAAYLIQRYTKFGEVVYDPFCGSGTVPLEALIHGRKAIACDASEYAAILTKAKLSPPATESEAIERADELLREAQGLPVPDLRSVPKWVRTFFNPDTLRDAIRFAAIAKRDGNEFWFACFLGILHHQRPGFLSYPSSHLVPYLRSKKYPRSEYPTLYEKRDLAPRLQAKIKRVYKRATDFRKQGTFHHQRAETQGDIGRVNAVITSPPYMNALDYERDNRLRLWFINPARRHFSEQSLTQKRKNFEGLMGTVISNTSKQVRKDGHLIMVVGEEVRRTFRERPSDIVDALIKLNAPQFCLVEVFDDVIPDIRRSRRNCHGIKQERILVYRKS